MVFKSSGNAWPTRQTLLKVMSARKEAPTASGALTDRLFCAPKDDKPVYLVKRSVSKPSQADELARDRPKGPVLVPKAVLKPIDAILSDKATGVFSKIRSSDALITSRLVRPHGLVGLGLPYKNPSTEKTLKRIHDSAHLTDRLGVPTESETPRDSDDGA